MSYVPYNNNEQTPILSRTKRIQEINRLRKLKAKIDNDLTEAIKNCGHVCVDLGGNDVETSYKCLYCGKTLEPERITTIEPIVNAAYYLPQYNDQPTKKIKHLQTMANEILEMNSEISDVDLVATMNFFIQEINNYFDAKTTDYNNGGFNR